VASTAKKDRLNILVQLQGTRTHTLSEKSCQNISKLTTRASPVEKILQGDLYYMSCMCILMYIHIHIYLVGNTYLHRKLTKRLFIEPM
jgi:hypothetical protein